MSEHTVNERIYEAALPLLRGRTVTDLVIGISMLAVELDGRDIAVSYVLRDNLKGGCSIFGYASEAVGMPAEEVGRWLVTGGDDIQRSIGGAVLTAASRGLDLRDSQERGPFDVALRPGDTVGMVGNIHPVAMMLGKMGANLMIFDKGKCAHGNSAENIYPMERQAELLPKCDIVFLSGTTTVNGTIDGLLDMCSGARDIVLVGASVPMIPQGYRDSGVTVLAGSWWDYSDKEEIFRRITRAAGMQGLKEFSVKKNVRI